MGKLKERKMKLGALFIAGNSAQNCPWWNPFCNDEATTVPAITVATSVTLVTDFNTDQAVFNVTGATTDMQLDFNQTATTDTINMTSVQSLNTTDSAIITTSFFNETTTDSSTWNPDNTTFWQPDWNTTMNLNSTERNTTFTLTDSTLNTTMEATTEIDGLKTTSETTTSTTSITTTSTTSTTTTTTTEMITDMFTSGPIWNITIITSDPSLTTCQRHRNKVLSSGLLGAWLPECNSDGDYELTQCNYSARYCWCVETDGTKVGGTEIQYELNIPEMNTCHAPVKVDETKCEKHSREVEESGMMGAWQPVCDENGDYKKRQCNFSSRTCWCVELDGKAIEGSSTFYGGIEHLLMEESNMCDLNQCTRLRNRIDNRAGEGMPDSVVIKTYFSMPEYYPQCDKDGHFHHKQCLQDEEHHAKCWCVDKLSGGKLSEIFRDGSNGKESNECGENGLIISPERPDANHNQDGLHLIGINVGEILENFIQDQLHDGKFHPRPGFGKVVESLIEGSNAVNINYAPVNTNVQNFIDVNTEIETDIDININGKAFGLDSLMDAFADKMKSGTDMKSLMSKLISCIKNFHLQEYIKEYSPLIREMAESKGISSDEFDAIIKELFKHM